MERNLFGGQSSWSPIGPAEEWRVRLDLSTEKRISVPRIMQMLNPVRSKQTAQPLLHLAAATSLSTTTLQRFCHRIAVIDGIACPLAHQEDIPRYGKACRQADSADKCLQQIYINADIPRYS